MASRYFGLNKGQNEASMTSASSTQNTDMEVRVDLSKVIDKHTLIDFLEKLKQFVLSTSTYPTV